VFIDTVTLDLFADDTATKNRNHINIYTCGACKDNHGMGGWGVVLTFGRHVKELFGGEPFTTNNKMSLVAAIKAFESVLRPCDVTLYTSSQYITNGIVTLSEWSRTKRLDPGNQDAVKNVGLWNDLAALMSTHSVQCAWIKKDTGDHWIDRAAYLAQKGMYLRDMNTEQNNQKLKIEKVSF